MRSAAVAAADQVMQNELALQEATEDPGNVGAAFERAKGSLQGLLDLRLPIGWNVNNSLNISDGQSVFLKVLGWIITTLAIMQGSDFWFNLLGRLTAARQAATKMTETSTQAVAAQQSSSGGN
jgi:hypothetical protein